MESYWSGTFKKTLTMILAGGRGERLYPLTQQRSKPAVPFGGMFRIIDFTMSNCINSGFRKIYLLTQYKSQSLDEHVRKGWNILSSKLDEFIYAVPPQQRYTDRWYSGTADAIFQNLNLLDNHKPEHVIILSGDHIYKMDYSKLLYFHMDREADVTISTIPVPVTDAKRFGICGINNDQEIIQFQEKPENPAQIPNRPGWCLGSMGVYIFKTDVLAREVAKDAKSNSSHDFGKDILPKMLGKRKMFAFAFEDENRKKNSYWRDIGTLDSYYDASMDLVSVDPEFNMYDENWPIHTHHPQFPPAKTVWTGDERRGELLESLICNGVIVSGGKVTRSILSPGVRVNSYATVDECILFNNVDIGRNVKIRRAIVDKNAKIPEGTVIGYDPVEDRKRFILTESGIVVIPKNYIL